MSIGHFVFLSDIHERQVFIISLCLQVHQKFINYSRHRTSLDKKLRKQIYVK